MWGRRNQQAFYGNNLDDRGLDRELANDHDQPWSINHTLAGEYNDRSKFKLKGHPLETEDRHRVMLAPGRKGAQLVEKDLEQIMRDGPDGENDPDAKKQTGRGRTSFDQLPERIGYAVESAKGERSRRQNKKHQDFVHSFKEFLRGNGQLEEYKKAGYLSYADPDPKKSKRGKSMPVCGDKQTLQWLADTQNRVLEYERDKAIRKLRPPRTLDDWWKFYKYVLHDGEGPEDEVLGFLRPPPSEEDLPEEIPVDVKPVIRPPAKPEVVVAGRQFNSFAKPVDATPQPAWNPGQAPTTPTPAPQEATVTVEMNDDEEENGEAAIARVVERERKAAEEQATRLANESEAKAQRQREEEESRSMREAERQQEQQRQALAAEQQRQHAEQQAQNARVLEQQGKMIDVMQSMLHKLAMQPPHTSRTLESGRSVDLPKYSGAGMMAPHTAHAPPTGLIPTHVAREDSPQPGQLHEGPETQPPYPLLDYAKDKGPLDTFAGPLAARPQIQHEYPGEGPQAPTGLQEQPAHQDPVMMEIDEELKEAQIQWTEIESKLPQDLQQMLHKMDEERALVTILEESKLAAMEEAERPTTPGRRRPRPDTESDDEDEQEHARAKLDEEVLSLMGPTSGNSRKVPVKTPTLQITGPTGKPPATVASQQRPSPAPSPAKPAAAKQQPAASAALSAADMRKQMESIVAPGKPLGRFGNSLNNIIESISLIEKRLALQPENQVDKTTLFDLRRKFEVILKYAKKKTEQPTEEEKKSNRMAEQTRQWAREAAASSRAGEPQYADPKAAARAFKKGESKAAKDQAELTTPKERAAYERMKKKNG